MKILFVYKEGIPLGIGYLSSFLKSRNHQTSLLFHHDTFSNVVVSNKCLSRWEEQTYPDIKDVLENFKPDIVGFSVMTVDYQWALAMARKIKEAFQVPIIFGGPHPTLLPKRTLANKEVDFVCAGEGEYALCELLDSMAEGKTERVISNIWRKNGEEIIPASLRDLDTNLDALPFPDRELFFKFFPRQAISEVGYVMASRGCPYSCSYCANELFNTIYKGKGPIIRRRSVANVIAECESLKNEWFMRSIHFQDDVFTSDINWLEELVELYLQKIRLPFSCLSHPNALSDKVIDTLKKGGCREVIVGVQTGSDRIRKDIFKRRESSSRVIDLAKNARKRKILVSFNHIFDAPSENINDIMESARVYNQARPHSIDCYTLAYFPKTTIIDIAKGYGILQDKDVEDIEEGIKKMYQVGYNLSETNYAKYSMFFILIPILTPGMVNRIINSPKLMRLINKLPMKSMFFIKLFIRLRNGYFFQQRSAIKYYILRLFSVVGFHFRRKKPAIANS